MPDRPAAVAALPAAPGVYRFRDAAGRVVYLGRATDLRSRVGSYWGDLRDRPHLRRMVPQVVDVEALTCASVHEATWLERNLLERSKPRWNRVRGGLEVPTWIALVEGAGTAELRVLHSPDDAPGAAVFGPYLGGGQSRLAVAGLDRVLALSYAGARRGGFDQDMARLRGVADGDLPARVERAGAVLSREPAAVAAALDALTRRRQEAAGACAFEVAARIQAELEAVAWVTAEQRVTAPHAPGTTTAPRTLSRTGPAPGPLATGPRVVHLHGYAGGVLVSFEVRDGRLDRWHQEAADEVRAATRVAATPEAWRTFTREAAELAARLRDAR
ncbi:hypothetical protein [Actinotalea fermentans]|uniref:GIY-YIG domain-containing protein n=1 Tax=Actinotalea fermentans TaxID=43671 RepID=A0A511YVA6_9CELL|nr:hypothetical protein [Actinotalea fermentans]GEN79142.1 hypothetical protein AFE02nite_08760 [Actinotalea fermentans]